MARFGMGRFLGRSRPVESILSPSASPVSCSVGFPYCPVELAFMSTGCVPLIEVTSTLSLCLWHGLARGPGHVETGIDKLPFRGVVAVQPDSGPQHLQRVTGGDLATVEKRKCAANLSAAPVTDRKGVGPAKRFSGVLGEKAVTLGIDAPVVAVAALEILEGQRARQHGAIGAGDIVAGVAVVIAEQPLDAAGQRLADPHAQIHAGVMDHHGHLRVAVVQDTIRAGKHHRVGVRPTGRSDRPPHRGRPRRRGSPRCR